MNPLEHETKRRVTLLDYSALNMETIYFSETSTDKSTLRQNKED